MSESNREFTSPIPSPEITLGHDGQTTHNLKHDLVVVENVHVPPREETIEVQDLEETEEVRTVQIPHTHIREEFEVVDVPVRKPRYIKEPCIDVLHRKIQIPKPVKKERYMEMPQLHVVDRIIEKPEPIYKEKLVEKPRYIIQERIVPIPKREVEEVTVKIPKDKFDEVVNSQIDGMQYTKTSRNELNPDGAEYYDNEGSRCGGERFGSEIGENIAGGTGTPGLYDIAAPQRINGPTCRHMPKPVDVPLVHYKPKPVERIVDRHVPIPVEMHVTQEFQCPILIPIWAEQAVPVHVTRVIEKPVPADAMTHKVLLDMYMNQTKHVDEYAENRMNGSGFLCGFKKNQTFPVRHKMTDAEIRAAGLDDDLDALSTMNSRKFEEIKPFNASLSGDFFTKERSLGQAKTNEGEHEEDLKLEEP